MERLYLTAFPEIERHPIDELFEACEAGNCEWLIFKDEDIPVGMAYMIVRCDVAFLLYLAVVDEHRNHGYGASILKELRHLYDGTELVLLIESLREECDNKEIRIRRRGFYLRNGLYDTDYIQPCGNGTVIYDIISSNPKFDVTKYMRFVREYPLKNSMGEAYRG